ncbi:MAG: acetolactate synthase large subunit [Acidimicrobiales bacterium]
MTPAEIAGRLVAAFRWAGTEWVFGVPGGGANLDMIGAAQAVGCRFVLAHSEGAATVMAAVTGEMTGTPGVVVVTRGPGAASAVNGAAQALLDRQPTLVITDCVTDADTARVSHQRIDQQAILGGATKASFRFGPYEASSGVAARIVALTVEGRPGPVHVDVDPTHRDPTHRERTHRDRTDRDDARCQEPVLDPAGAAPTAGIGSDRLRGALARSRRPVVIAGGGFVTGRPDDRDAAVTSLRRVVAQGHIPVLTTYKGRGVVADSAEYCAGVATGATIEASVLEDADLIIGVGLDPVELIPGAWTYGADVVLLGRWQIDDSTFFGARLVAEVVGELDHLINTFVAGLATEWTPGTGARHRQDAADALTAAVPTAANGLTPQQVVTIARRVAPPGTIATVDAGAHMLVAVPLWGTERPGELLVSSGLATMGYALPAAAAAALVHPDRRVICFTGDGGLGMVLAELETLARLGLRVTVVVFNDATLSLIAIKQRAEGHGGEDAVRYAPMDFAAIGAACGLASARVVDASGYEAAMRAALAHEGPTIVDVTVDPSAYPAVIDAIRGARRSLSS